MTDTNKLRRYTTVELHTPNPWGIFHNGKTLSTYEVCSELNDLAVENEKLKKQIECLREENTELNESLMELESFKKLLKSKGIDLNE